jgi:6-pyruvoyltetrahydropterin/6-carboxytetrahydropterin synthase
MYTVKKRLEISAAHRLNLSYESKCGNLHGHNWIIEICCRSKELNRDGMVVDFSHVKKQVTELLDHKNLNEVFNFNTTAENMARCLCDRIPNCYKVMVRESENNTVWYERD